MSSSLNCCSSPKAVRRRARRGGGPMVGGRDEGAEPSGGRRRGGVHRRLLLRLRTRSRRLRRSFHHRLTATAVASADELEVLDDHGQLMAFPAALLVFPTIVFQTALNEDRLALGEILVDQFAGLAKSRESTKVTSSRLRPEAVLNLRLQAMPNSATEVWLEDISTAGRASGCPSTSLY